MRRLDHLRPALDLVAQQLAQLIGRATLHESGHNSVAKTLPKGEICGSRCEDSPAYGHRGEALDRGQGDRNDAPRWWRPVPASTRCRHWYLRLSSPVTKAEQWYRLFPNHPAGGYPHRGLADARQEAARLWSMRSAGVDPRAKQQHETLERLKHEQEEREATQRRLNVRELFDRWVLVELTPQRRSRWQAQGSACRPAAGQAASSRTGASRPYLRDRRCGHCCKWCFRRQAAKPRHIADRVGRCSATSWLSTRGHGLTASD